MAWANNHLATDFANPPAVTLFYFTLCRAVVENKRVHLPTTMCTVTVQVGP